MAGQIGGAGFPGSGSYRGGPGGLFVRCCGTVLGFRLGCAAFTAVSGYLITASARLFITGLLFIERYRPASLTVTTEAFFRDRL